MALRAGWSRIGPLFAALWLAVTCMLAWIGIARYHEDSMNVRVVDADTTLARRALTVSPLDYEPITSDTTVAPHLVIVGTGGFVRSLALHAIRTGVYANGKRLAVTIVGPNVSRVVEALELIQHENHSGSDG